MEELIRIGAYRAGADPQVDRAIALNPALEAFLAQDKDEVTSLRRRRSSAWTASWQVTRHELGRVPDQALHLRGGDAAEAPGRDRRAPRATPRCGWRCWTPRARPRSPHAAPGRRGRLVPGRLPARACSCARPPSRPRSTGDRRRGGRRPRRPGRGLRGAEEVRAGRRERRAWPPPRKTARRETAALDELGLRQRAAMTPSGPALARRGVLAPAALGARRLQPAVARPDAPRRPIAAAEVRGPVPGRLRGACQRQPARPGLRRAARRASSPSSRRSGR